MSEIDMQATLARMRALSAEAARAPVPAPTTDGVDFGSLLKRSIDTVNANQQTASQMAQAFETGESDASLSEVMISLQKASVSFQAMLQVRNKLIEAYKDVMNMPM